MSRRNSNKNMAVKNLTLPSFPTFDLGEVDTIAPKWKKYKQRFSLLCTAIGVTEEKQKLAMLLTYVGDETYELYENVIQLRSMKLLRLLINTSRLKRTQVMKLSYSET